LLVLIVDPHSVSAGQDFAKKESLQGKFSFFYEANKAPTEADLARLGVHYIHKPDISQLDIVLETHSTHYLALVASETEIHPDTNTAVDVSSNRESSQHIHDKLHDRKARGDEKYVSIGLPALGQQEASANDAYDRTFIALQQVGDLIWERSIANTTHDIPEGFRAIEPNVDTSMDLPQAPTPKEEQ
jgi:hypothetical protein